MFIEKLFTRCMVKGGVCADIVGIGHDEEGELMPVTLSFVVVVVFDDG